MAWPDRQGRQLQSEHSPPTQNHRRAFLYWGQRGPDSKQLGNLECLGLSAKSVLLFKLLLGSVPGISLGSMETETQAYISLSWPKTLNRTTLGW